MTDENAHGPSTGSVAPPPAFAPPVGEPSTAFPPPADSAPALPAVSASRPPFNGLAIAALICGLLALAPAAIVLGHVGFAQAGRSGQRGRGLAVAGFVLGYVVIIAVVIGWFAYSAFVSGLRDGGYLPV